MISRITRSLSARLLGIFLLTSIVYAFGTRYAVELVLDRDYLREIVGAHASRYASYMLEDLGYPPRVERAQAMVEGSPYDIRIDGPDLHWASDPDFPDPSTISFEDSQLLDRIRAAAKPGQHWIKALNQLSFARYDRHSYTRVKVGDYTVTVVSPKVAEHPPPDLTRWIVALMSILVLAGCYVAVRWVIRPINWIKEGADRIGHGDLDYRIPVVRNDELGELTVEINRMAEDVQEMLEAKRQLLLAISHELRSPLTRAKLALEFLEDDQTRQSLLEDIREMERLIHDLLEGEQLNSRHSALNLAKGDIAELLRNLVRDEFGDMRSRIDLDLPPGPVEAEFDAVRVRLLVKNLLSNALCYTPEDAPPVRLSLKAGSGQVSIRVIDHGPGMSAQEVARATEPFYRADPARCRDTGGFGLGLFLCRRIAEAHGGSLRIDSVEGRGTEIEVILPVHPHRSCSNE